VITGSRNFHAARSSTPRTFSSSKNAVLTKRYIVYIDHLLQKYADEVAPL